MGIPGRSFALFGGCQIDWVETCHPRISSWKLQTTTGFPRCLLHVMTSSPVGRPGRIEQLAVLSNRKLKMGIPAEQKGCEMGLCSRVQSDGRSGMSRMFQVALFGLQLHVILVFFPALGVSWCSGPGSFGPMNGDGAAHGGKQGKFG